MSAVALTIAGSDPSGGAGIQADLKTFHQHGVYGEAVITLLTAQNTRGVSALQTLEPAFIAAQLDAVIDDIPPTAAKSGALGAAAIIAHVAARAANFGFPLIVDPVMISKHGHALLAPDAAEVLRRGLLPHAWLATPNVHEAAALAEMQIDDIATMERAAQRLSLIGARNVLIKGGALHSDSNAVCDILLLDGEIHRFVGPRFNTPNVHGSGCVFSAAITARVARGESLLSAVDGARRFVADAIRLNPQLGHGCGPLNLHTPPPPAPATPT